MDLNYSLETSGGFSGPSFFGGGRDHPAVLLIMIFLVIFSAAAKSQQSKQRRMIIDGCKDCNLFWFDEGELEKLTGSEVSEIKARGVLNEWLEADPIEWIDKKSKDNIKLYDTEGNIIVIGIPTAKIDTQKTYDIEGNVIAEASVTVGVKPAVANKRKVIFMDSDSKTKADEIKKLKRLYEEGYLTKERYNSLKKDLKK
jgi:Zn-finger nucleic acid-binding protein